MPHVQTGLDVRTSEAVMHLQITNDLHAQEIGLAAGKRDPRDQGHQENESLTDAGKNLLLSAAINENCAEADQKEMLWRIAELDPNEEVHANVVGSRAATQRDQGPGTSGELRNNDNGMTATNPKTTSTQGNSLPPTFFIDRSAGDLVRNKAKALKASNIISRISNGVAEVSHVARKVPRQLKVIAKQNKKKTQAPQRLAKYYFQRYRLFHRFDEGVLMDDVSWYSVTPEKIAKHIAERFTGRQMIVDLYSGAGGNSIQFALNGAYVIAVENSQSRIEIARNNARVYGVEQFIEFVAADVVDALKMMKDSNMVVDGIFMSPPWGGPEYQETESYDVGAFKRVVDLARTVTKDVGILVPRNVSGENVLRWFGPCEMEWNYLGTKAKTVTIYFGDLIRFPDDTR